MEPPARRLRILQSVEVDETNPDYVDAKQKQQQKFKGTLESIFAKYENMHESMSDEIDMRANKVVVDRGHLRRLARQAHRDETVLLNSLALGTGPEHEDDGSGEEKGEEDSEDELAPTQPVVSRSVLKQKRRQSSAAVHDAQSPPVNGTPPTAPFATPLSVAAAQTALQPVPNTPNPAASLLQLVQFPQTPAGQQAQSSFYATLAQTINNAVQQAVAPLFSGILPNTPHVQVPLPNALPLQTTPAPNTDTIAPAKDPKWFFPPLSSETHSTPVPAPAISSAAPEAAEEEPCIPESDPQSAPDTDFDTQLETISTSALMRAEELAGNARAAAKVPRRTSPRVEIQRRPRRPATKYVFTEEDDIYVSKMRILHNHSWTEIRDSREKWKHWPPSTFSNRWKKHLMERNLHTKEHPIMHDKQEDKPIYSNKTVALPLHRLPTPSSSGYEDDNLPVTDGEIDHVVHTTSSAQFNDDERELLSLAGADLEEEQLLLGSGEEETSFLDADEVILPSIEQTPYVDEVQLQQGLLEDSTNETIHPITPVKIKSEDSLSSPPPRRKRTRAEIACHPVPRTETEVEYHDQVDNLPVTRTKDSFVCEICDTTFKTLKILRNHQANPRSTHNKLRPRSPSIDLVGNDELQVTAPATPRRFKRDFSTPPATSFLFSTPAAQSHPRTNIPSSDTQSTTGLSRKAYLKQIKHSWTKKSTPVTKTVSKRESFHILPRKRTWADVADSDDELAS